MAAVAAGGHSTALSAYSAAAAVLVEQERAVTMIYACMTSGGLFVVVSSVRRAGVVWGVAWTDRGASVDRTRK